MLVSEEGIQSEDEGEHVLIHKNAKSKELLL